MIKYLLFIILNIAQLNLNAQGLKVNELVQLRTKNVTNVETYLTNKNWIFASSGEETETKPAIIAFSKNIVKKDHIFQFIYSETSFVYFF
jgi:RecB family endonuclease NucS